LPPAKIRGSPYRNLDPNVGPTEVRKDNLPASVIDNPSRHEAEELVLLGHSAGANTRAKLYSLIKAAKANGAESRACLRTASTTVLSAIKVEETEA